MLQTTHKEQFQDEYFSQTLQVSQIPCMSMECIVESEIKLASTKKTQRY